MMFRHGPCSTANTSPKPKALLRSCGFRADGTWEVSYDDGGSWNPLLQDGKPVNAVGENVSFGYSSVFKSVVYDEENHLFSSSSLRVRRVPSRFPTTST